VSIAGSALLLGWLWTRLDGAETLRLLSGARPGPLLLAAALVPVQVVLSAERWHRAAGALSLSLPRAEAIREYALSILLNQVLPGGMAGDAIRVWRQRRPERLLGPSLRAAVAERGIGLGVHCAVTVAGLAAWSWVHPDIPRPPAALPIAVVAGALLAAVVASRDVRLAALSRGVFGWNVGLSVLLTGSFLASFSLCGAALGLPLGGAAFTVVPLVLLAMVVPVTVGGWGMREAVALALLPAVGWSEEAAVAVASAYGLVNLAAALPGALVPLVPR